jgi:hypothetical protein
MGNGGVSCSPSPWGLRLTRVLGRFGCSGCSAGAEIPIHLLEGPVGATRQGGAGSSALTNPRGIPATQ